MMGAWGQEMHVKKCLGALHGMKSFSLEKKSRAAKGVEKGV